MHDAESLQRLTDLIDPALRTVNIRLGYNAREMLQRGERVGLSGGEYADLAWAAAQAVLDAGQGDGRPAARRRLTELEHAAAWHAIEGTAGEDGADPGTVLAAVLRALDIDPPARDCPACEVGIEHDVHCPTPESHNWGCGCSTDERPAAEAAEREAGRRYPHAAGETTVLGPEIFASTDGQTISWRGVNYVPQQTAAEGAGA